MNLKCCNINNNNYTPNITLRHVTSNKFSWYRCYSTLSQTAHTQDDILQRYRNIKHDSWTDLKNQRNFMDWLRADLDLQADVSLKKHLKPQLIPRGSRVILQVYNNSIDDMLSAVYPETRWEAISVFSPRLRQALRGQHLEFCKQFAVKHNLKSPNDWYSVGTKQFYRAGGSEMLKLFYNNSLYSMLRALFPEVRWKKNQFVEPELSPKIFCETYARTHNITNIDQWYNVLQEDVRKAGGTAILEEHNGSLYQVLRSAYPNYPWDHMRWKKTSYLPTTATTLALSEQTKMVKQFEDTMGISKMEQWYSVTFEDWRAMWGASLINTLYGGSVYKLLCAVYPRFAWLPWKFRGIPRHWWKEGSNVKTWMKWVQSELKIQSPADWLQVPTVKIKQMGGYSAIKHFGGTQPLLEYCFPDAPWEELFAAANNSKFGGKFQTWLQKAVQDIFPQQTTICYNYLLPGLTATETSRSNEIDIYLPSFSLGLEYNGEMHYQDNFLFGDPESAMSRDARKVELCQQLGVTLITVPYWWDMTPQSIAATIHKIRPDVIPHPPVNSHPIPTAVELGADPTWRARAALGKRMSRPGFLFHVDINEEYNVDLDNYEGWWMSKCISGLRVIWDGEKQVFYMTGGGFLRPPSGFSDLLPTFQFWDGVLSFGDKESESETVLLKLRLGAARRARVLHLTDPTQRSEARLTNAWQGVRLWLLDMPGLHTSFEGRMQHMNELLSTMKRSDVVQPVEYKKCNGRSDIIAGFCNVLRSKDSNAIMLKEPNTFYIKSRSPTLVKVQVANFAAAIIVDVRKNYHYNKLTDPVSQLQWNADEANDENWEESEEGEADIV